MKVLAVYILIQIVLCHEIGERFEFQNDPEPDGECGVLMYHTFYGSCRGATCFVTVDEGRQNHEVCSMAGAPLNTDCEYFEEENIEGACNSATKRCEISRSYKHPFCGLP
ncbi:hypothetical protein Ddc_10273 [Ditylenchus destructor]|nr:hypothetical protein Ddc_10273 [Ditylenchus destructor]